MARETNTHELPSSGRGSVIVSVLQRQLTQAEAASQLRLSVRQVRRLVRAYRLAGVQGLVSKHRGKPAHNAIDTAVRNHVLELVRTRDARR